VTDSDRTVKILREIRDAILSTNARLDARLDQTNARLDQTNARLDQANARLDKGFSGVVAILKHHEAQVIFLGRYAKNRTEKELRDLRTRVANLERKVG
jgi:predicted NBD/HSP70 family sugar kinase